MVSIFYDSSILAIIGLGLVFWGALLLFFRPETYVKETLLNAATIPSMVMLNQMIDELDYTGDAVYLPPRYFTNHETTKMYISKRKTNSLPTPELIQRYENHIFVKNGEGLLLTPLGAELASVFEKKLGTTFMRLDIDRLEQKMPELFVEDFEIAEKFEMEILPQQFPTRTSEPMSDLDAEYFQVQVRITNPISIGMCEESNSPALKCGRAGCPICSSIGCALTKATGEPVIIESARTTEEGKTVEISYHILGKKS